MNPFDRKKSLETLVLTAEDVAKIVHTCGRHHLMDRMIEALTAGFGRLTDDEVTLKPRRGFNWKEPGLGLLEWMPILEKNRSITIKVVSYIPDNPKQRGLPTVVGTVSLYDPASGHLQALADGVLLTALRTGAVSAVATRLLAHGDGGTVGLVGCGMQAVTQLHALSRVFEPHRVLVHDIDPELEASFLHRVAFLGLEIQTAPLSDIERLSDVLVTNTSVDVGQGPVIRGTHLKPHVHINAVGSDFPGKTELPLAVLKRSLVCPDFRAQALLEGECQQLTDEHIGPELADLVRDPEAHAAWRERSTVFDSTGSALEDHIAMKLLVDLAEEHGIGERLRLEHLPADSYDPYALPESDRDELRETA